MPRAMDGQRPFIRPLSYERLRGKLTWMDKSMEFSFSINGRRMEKRLPR